MPSVYHGLLVYNIYYYMYYYMYYYIYYYIYYRICLLLYRYLISYYIWCICLPLHEFVDCEYASSLWWTTGIFTTIFATIFTTIFTTAEDLKLGVRTLEEGCCLKAQAPRRSAFSWTSIKALLRRY